jgi:hypothetical protein
LAGVIAICRQAAGAPPTGSSPAAAPSPRASAAGAVRQRLCLYDLGSTRGTRFDGDAVPGRALLNGVHRVMVGRVEVEVGVRADLLV